MADKITVLLAEDEVDFRKIMTFWLESKGYSVITAGDGQSAVIMVKEKNPDIIFLDLNMPIMDGNTALKKIREFNKDIPVIIISAHINTAIADEIMSQNDVSGIFHKSDDFETGLSLLESILRRHKKLKNQR